MKKRVSLFKSAASIVVVAGMALGMVGCSSTESESESSADVTSSADGAYPVSIATKFGDVTVESQPERVVALGWGDAEAALEFGVQPVGASDWLAFGGEGVGPWIEDSAYDEAPEIIGTMEPEYEKIAALEPDLILDVRSSGDQERYDKLSSIALTIGVPEGGDSYLTPRAEQVTMIATALGQAERGEEVNAEYEQLTADIRAAHPGWPEKTAAAVSATATSWGAYIKGSNRVDTLLDLGFQENPELAKQQPGDTGFSIKFSEETFGVVDSDLVVGFAIGMTPEEMAEQVPWQMLTATRDGRSFVMPREISNAFSLGSPQSTRFALDALVPLLEEHAGE
ncbi:ABC-type putative iron-siderophore transporter, substrate-binding lipoprotein [Corynebacterium glutamicum MB001]|uniref:ABC-type Fe3+-siderophores transport systems, periplasmic components n=1 Tax=Corynebacterium glutamicum (strain ATCC 13032 / DSM 20300 / JCM 1318 / BCRC 11384 / CCUG 27702 / LMG 3730 / NBRC 12168 / NCIMB 10025 / NRRL B-2784 / 534) TaxID=196627 RepID=Q8NR07_CORGL|nr:iron-siderophore ABC transporter substrate-binding protein [Corynebacterium glutamicum]AGT05246.1 ABC-type putative iron-siderophore transporter, substrate-binding lipoprotein [Corynebacterium glutamicum MB001]ARV64589.1 ABC transporter substrate-binding protein [Corynebacterium glutamicum]ASW13895.1 ABC-type putative iron-siderophore transporter, substrate-binding lipoprotein [Corynebacterium glutamicum]AUI00790.1 iron-siderophore ABC transporter substrate-binding protein [Corynebacterium g